MIKLTVYLIKIALILPLIAVLSKALSTVALLRETLRAIPFIISDTTIMVLVALILVAPTIFWRTKKVVMIFSLLYIVPALLSTGTISELLPLFGYSFHFWNLNVTYVAYFLLVSVLGEILDDVLEKARILEDWNISGIEETLHYLLGAEGLLVILAGIFALLYSRHAISLGTELPAYALPLGILLLGLVLLLGILPEKPKKTIGVVKTVIKIGPSYTIEPTGDEVVVRDEGLPQEREVVASFELTETYESIILKTRDARRKLKKAGEFVVDGVRYVVYSDKEKITL
ncbi:hypothetical protein E3E31_01190 [Thermococcus sp. M39]|uniref:hypothetical protein n=1 Tax=unclassified Thermococcus TaxID=2627626 RepID=UPI001439A292|nr:MULTISPECIES: hypothetical protein [unclassified Thermococcus]NJE07170.1 hypothetical protein [Thermococcus sp. M39]NJE12698.1 hypothetical protein [Thermococcus sp. LS2]